MEGPLYEVYFQNKGKTPQNVIRILEATVKEANRIAEEEGLLPGEPIARDGGRHTAPLQLLPTRHLQDLLLYP
ncbi:hypothetical protein IIA15_08780 [candidate division TA06 bacterium]|nr:hypothetical protein [candidate division TA06 bacterium]